MNVIVIAPHPDDESIGPGGSLAAHVAKGDTVRAIFLTSGEGGIGGTNAEAAMRTRETEAQTAAAELGLSDLVFLRLPDWTMGDDVPAAAGAVAPHLARLTPGAIYLPHPGEWHPDHAAALRVVLAALRQAGVGPRLWGYEVWTPMPKVDRLEDISAQIGRKIRAIRSHRSQAGAFRYDRAAFGLNLYRSALGGPGRFAEAFVDLTPAS